MVEKEINMKTIQRKNLPSDYDEMMVTESHHYHEIIIDKHGVIRWKENKEVRNILNKTYLKDISMLLHALGYGYNSEIYRKL